MDKHEIEKRHARALANPHYGYESGLVHALRAIEHLATAHQAAYGSPIADDGVMGPAWLDMAKGIETMLSGERGRLDGGLFDRELRDLAFTAGFTRDLTERS